MHRRFVIVGAGPYGLAVAAKLQSAGVDYVLIGRPLAFWKEYVPQGLALLSEPLACSLSLDGFGVDAWEKSRGCLCRRPFPAEEFVEYCLWFQRHACITPDERAVVQVVRDQSGGYTVHLEDGDVITAEHLIVAAGLKAYSFRPPEFAGLRPGTGFHASELKDLSGFCEKKVVVIGSGQSAFECGALLHEQKAEVEIIARESFVRWRPYGGHVRRPSGVAGYARAAVRTVLNNPAIFRRAPGAVRAWWLGKTLRAAPDDKLKARLESVRLTLGRRITVVAYENDRVKLQLDDGTSRIVDHVVFGTGYRIDVNALSFLTPELRREVAHYRGYPHLNGVMESTVPRLYFIGAPAAMNFGADMWFVHGAPFTAERIIRVAGARSQPAATAEPAPSG
jgi:FAD-dependent urate hydroxylase